MTTFTKKTTLTIFSIMLLVAVLCMATFGILFQMNSVKAEMLPGDSSIGWGDDSIINDVTYHYDIDSIISYNIVYGDYSQDGYYDNLNDIPFVDNSNNVSFLPSNLAKIKSGSGISHYIVTFVFNCDNVNALNLNGSLAWNGMYHLATFGGATSFYKNSFYLCYDNSDTDNAGYYLLTPSGCHKVAHRQFDGTRFILQLLFNASLSYPYNFYFNIFNNNFRYQCTIGHQSSDIGDFGHALDLCVYHNLPSLYYLYSSNSTAADSFQIGYDAGRDYGYNNGYNVGYDKGYSNGHADGMSTNGGLTSVIPTTLGAIGSFFKDLFSFEVFGISFFAILGSIGAILLAIWIIKMAKGG